MGAVSALKFHSFIHKTENFKKLYEIYSLSDFESCLKTYVEETGYWARNRGSNLIGIWRRPHSLGSQPCELLGRKVR